MLPSSHETLINSEPPVAERALLAEAFSDFIAVSSRLEHSYRDLQAKVAELGQALSDRNRALSDSLSENRNLGDRLQRILETIPCGVMVLGQDGSVRLVNPEAVRLLNLSSACGDGLDHAIIRPETPLHAYISAREQDAEQELCFEGPQGPMWVAIRRVHLPGAARPAVGKTEILLTIRDISARRRMEQDRERARDTVALAQVSALLAHEIRNPLASLELFAGLLEDNPERQQEWLSHLRAGIRSLSGTVNNVLTLHGNTPLALETVDVLTETTLAVDFLQPIAREARVSLRLLVHHESVPHTFRISGNRSSLHQILLNLCVNALRHTPAGGAVEVICHVPAESSAELQIAVADTGCGIPPHHLPHLFEVGFSGSGTTSGLGLAVCDRLVRQIGGALRVESRVGHGSTFTLELPQA